MGGTNMALFIGGAADGRRLSVPEGAEHWEVAVRPPLQVGMNAPVLSPDHFEVRKEIYDEMRFRGGNTSYWVFAQRGLSADEVMGRLIDGYRNK